MKALLEILEALYAVRDAIRGKNGDDSGNNEKSLNYFELTNNPIGVIRNNLASPEYYDEEALIKIEDFVEQLGVPKEVSKGGIPPTFVFVYDKDVSNTVNFNTIQEHDTIITNGDKDCIELASNRFCFSLAE